MPVVTTHQGPASVPPHHDDIAEAATPRPPVKYGTDLHVRDIIRFLSSDFTITALSPYPNPHLFDFMDDRWRIAQSGDWGMTIDPDALWAQLANGVWVVAHHYPDQDVSFGVPIVRPRPVAITKVQNNPESDISAEPAFDRRLV